MQGTLNEIDIRSILQLIELGQRTGELFIEAYPNPRLIEAQTSSSRLKVWYVFFVNGQIAYATEQKSNPLSRLQDYLTADKIQTRLDPSFDSSTTTINTPEYAYLWRLLATDTLTPQRGREILQAMVLETLFDLFSLQKGAFIFEMGSAIAPQLTTLEITPSILKIARQVQQWKQFHPYIQHLDQFLAITHAEELKASLPEQTYRTLAGWARRKTTLRRLSRYLQKDVLTIAHNLYPYAQRGWLQLVSFEPESTRPTPTAAFEKTETRSPHVVFIEDDLTVGKNVEIILEKQNYRYTLFSDPLEALSQVFQIEPDVILCDIALPRLDGYEFCAMLRHSRAFRSIPIIMLTGKEGFIDRVKAKMVGATDYLTKPFGENELLLLLEKYTPYSETGNPGEKLAGDSGFY